jgi:hypothetical protein
MAPHAAQRRAQHSKPVLKQIEALALQHLHGVLPGSLLGKALHYLSRAVAKLVRYVEDGRYPIDNNACENAIRPFVVGKTELAVRRHGGRRQRQREPVLAAADLRGQRHRRLPLPQCVAGWVAQGQDRRGLRELAALAPRHCRTLISNGL